MSKLYRGVQDNENWRRCTRCGELWPKDTYRSSTITSDGLRLECYGCLRADAWRRSGVKQPFTWQDFCDMFPGQCMLCGTEDPGKNDWQLDHDHETGGVRGILCINCNRSLGWYEQNRLNIFAYMEESWAN